MYVCVPDKSAISTRCASSFSFSVVCSVSGVMPLVFWFAVASASVRALIVRRDLGHGEVVVCRALLSFDLISPRALPPPDHADPTRAI